MEKYITSLKTNLYMLKILPVLTVEQIKNCDNDCIRMYLYCYYNYPEFYKYKKKKLNRYIDNYKANLILFSAWCGNVNVLKYLVSRGLNVNYKNSRNCNAYIYACFNGQIEMLKYLETTNINIYQRAVCRRNTYDFSFMYSHSLTIYNYLMNKILYHGYSKICSICYENKVDVFITCKNNHVVHLKCQQQKNKDICLNCSFKYLI